MLGRFGISKAGHDKGTVYVIVSEEADSFFVTDGKNHPLAKPKKKNRKHIQLTNAYLSEEILGRMKNKETVYDHEIKKEIRNRKGEENV